MQKLFRRHILTCSVTFINTTDPYNDPLSPEELGVTADTPSQSNASHDQQAGFDWDHPNSTPAEPRAPSTEGLHALSIAASAEQYGHIRTRASITDRPASTIPTTPAQSAFDQAVATPASVTSSTNNINFILNHPSQATPPIDPHLRSPHTSSVDGYTPRPRFTRRRTSNIIDPSPVLEHEVAFLLRYFSEGPGLWMDLFDLGLYFTYYVPAKAVTNPLLKYAAVACSAKALGRHHGIKPKLGGNATRQARMELYPDIRSVDWFHKAAMYYDHAVSLLRQAIQDDSHQASSGTPAVSENDTEMTWQQGEPDAASLNGSERKRRRLSSLSQKTSSDEILAATAILSVYEFLDASVPEWSRYLNGAKSLIDVAKDRMMPLQLPSPSYLLHQSTQFRISKANKACFWNIARQDMLAACKSTRLDPIVLSNPANMHPTVINENRTRLDPDDLPLWKEAGLLIDSNGFVQPSNTTASGYPEGPDVMREDMISNALIWLMAKLVNFMAAGDEPFTAEVGSPSTPATWQAVPQRTLLDYWHHLREHFHVWYDGLPITFKPSAYVPPNRIPPALVEGDLDLSSSGFGETWYAIPMCASTMQSYHMAQIQLLVNKPHESTQGRTTIFARFNSYETAISESQDHARAIVSIALGRAEAGVRIHSVQPLYTAGQCLRDETGRKTILRLLRDIENDTGWATEYRVRQLVSQWGWDERGGDG